MPMVYGKDILKRVDSLAKDLKAKFTVYFSIGVYKEFQRKCAGRPASIVLEELMKHFNETTPEPRAKK